MAFSALLDANVLHPIGLCDLLLRLAEKGLYRPLWSEEILDECNRSVLHARKDIDPTKLQRRIDYMTEAFPDASVKDWRPLEASLTPEFGSDAHVVAAAIVGRADVIVTENVRDFPRTPTLDQHRIDVQRVDEFLVNQWWLSPTLVRGVVIEMAAARKKPTRTPHQVLDLLAKVAPEFVDQVRTALT